MLTLSTKLDSRALVCRSPHSIPDYSRTGQLDPGRYTQVSMITPNMSHQAIPKYNSKLIKDDNIICRQSEAYYLCSDKGLKDIRN